MHAACATCAPACKICLEPLTALLTEVGVNCNANAATVPAALAKVVEAARAANVARGDRQDAPGSGARGATAEDDDDDDDDDDDGGAIAADGESDGDEEGERDSTDVDLAEAVRYSEEEGKAALDAFVLQYVVCPVAPVAVVGRHSPKPLAGARPTLKRVRRRL
jgi:hypothetical protein